MTTWNITMPLMKKKTYARRRKAAPRRRYAPRRGARVALPKRTTGNFASSTEQFSLGVTAGVTNDFTFSLDDLVRTKNIALAYQYYRITSVELRFKPYFDTWANGLSSGQTMPYLNFQYDKAGALTGMTAVQFEQIGTKAIRLDDKTIVRKWRPSVQTTGLVPPGNVSQFKVSPWLPTHVAGQLNTPDHFGAVWYISKTSPADGTVYDVDVVVNVQFRKPLVPVSEGQGMSVNPPRIKQGNMTTVDVSLNPGVGQ